MASQNTDPASDAGLSTVRSVALSSDACMKAEVGVIAINHVP